MTGGEQVVVWLSGLFLGAVTVTAAARSLAEAWVAVAKARAGTLHVPPDWAKDGGS